MRLRGKNNACRNTPHASTDADPGSYRSTVCLALRDRGSRALHGNDGRAPTSFVRLLSSGSTSLSSYARVTVTLSSG